MIQFDRGRYLKIQSGAVGLADDLHAAVRDLLENGAHNIFFSGSGGAAILMQPAAQMLQRQAGLPVFFETAADLTSAGHAGLGPHSIVVIPSLSGTTRESLALLDTCKAKGAKVIALTGHADSPLAKGASCTFVNFAEDDTSCESFYVQSLLIALSVLDLCGKRTDRAATVAELRNLPALLAGVKDQFDPRARTHAEAMSAEPYHLITAAGNCWAEAWYFGMCILEEMQWIRTRPVPAADFFHGPLELVEEGVSVLLLKGEDACRPQADRVGRFAAEYTDKLFVVDTAEFDLPGLSAGTRALVAPAVLAAALQRLAEHLAVLRNHPLTVRRYYKRVAY
ncbi:MAG: SIS domain-containing protein [Alphaproteobacteria bacterium]|nr:SIS domain-containing protein [Alphaproteobacteria bacterium]